jgi:hypothetical protein
MKPQPLTNPDDLQRIPGLFRRWEIAQLIEAGEDYRIEDAGTTSDGTVLFSIYKSDATPEEEHTGEDAR